MQQPGGQTWNGGTQIANRGAGHHWPPAGDDPGSTYDEDVQCWTYREETSSVANPNFLGENTLTLSEQQYFVWDRLSKHKTTRYSRNSEGHGPPGYAYGWEAKKWTDRYLAKPDLLKGRDVNSAVCFVKCFSMQVGTLNTRRGLTTLDGAWGKNQV